MGMGVSPARDHLGNSYCADILKFKNFIRCLLRFARVTTRIVCDDKCATQRYQLGWVYQVWVTPTWDKNRNIAIYKYTNGLRFWGEKCGVKSIYIFTLSPRWRSFHCFRLLLWPIRTHFWWLHSHTASWFLNIILRLKIQMNWPTKKRMGKK